MTNFPQNCLRGLRSKDSICDDGSVNTIAYMPDKRTVITRIDGHSETSINWEDNEQVLNFTFEKKDQCAFGVARLALSSIEIIRDRLNMNFTYERNAKDDNPYHGNLLFQHSLPEPKKKMIAGALALFSERIKPPGL